MNLRKIMGMDGGQSAGITLPKDDLEADGLIEDGELAGEHYANVERIGDGEYKLELVCELD